MLGKVVHSGKHTQAHPPVCVCVLAQLQQHFSKEDDLDDNQHETLTHVARRCYAACNGASPNGAIILNISIIPAASSLFLPFSHF